MQSILRTIVLPVALSGSVVACHQDSVTSAPFEPPPPPPPAPALESISPIGAVSGSPDLTVTLSGSGFRSGIKGSWAVWRRGNDDTFLNTTFVSSSQLTAVVPAELLRDAVAAELYVATGDLMADGPFVKTKAVAFTIERPHLSSLPIVFDAGTLVLGQSVAFSRTLRSTDPICLYWWDRLGFDVAEPCHGYRVTIAAAGHLTAKLTWSPIGWMSLSNEDQAGLPTLEGPPMQFNRAVQAGQIVVVTVGNHGGNARVDYNLQLQLAP